MIDIFPLAAPGFTLTLLVRNKKLMKDPKVKEWFLEVEKRMKDFYENPPTTLGDSVFLNSWADLDEYIVERKPL